MTDGVAAFGGTDDVLKRATIAIQQMSGKGVIQMEELRQQLGEAMPRAVELMARSMGVSMPQLIQTSARARSMPRPRCRRSSSLSAPSAAQPQQQMQTFNGGA
jgi:tape measure domain-containing protein